jgi:hypothetical protein
MRSTAHVNILVPIPIEDDRPFPDAEFHMFEDFLARSVGSFSRRRDDIDGVRWSTARGKSVRVRSRAYAITLDAATADEQTQRIERFIRRHLRERAAFLELITYAT